MTKNGIVKMNKNKKVNRVDREGKSKREKINNERKQTIFISFNTLN